ncbi:MAG: hypothetical protein J0L80_07210 [Chitinophagales bacterium]|nr:hypothetical protein [Chitinophagales bacterium]
MKKLLAIAASVLLLGACRKDPEVTPPVANGTASATINGKTWVGNQSAYSIDYKYSNRVSLSINIIEGGLSRQQLNIERINSQLKSQPIYARFENTWGTNYKDRTGDSCLAIFHLTDDDILENSYNVLDGDSRNMLYVDSHDETAKRLKGRFSLVLYRMNIKSPQTQGFGDTLIIKDGVFDLPYKNNKP